MTWEISCCNAVDGIRKLADESVHLCLTSVPFNCGIDYKGYDDNQIKEDYFIDMLEVFHHVYDKMISGGRVIINLPTAVMMKNSQGVHELVVPLFQFQKIMDKIGFKFRDIIIWAKGKEMEEVLRLNSTNWGTWCSPSNPSVRSFTEFLVVWYKDTRTLRPTILNYPIPKGDFPVLSEPDLKGHEFPIFTNGLWLIPGRSSKHHPAVWPEELVRRAIKLYTWRGNTVVDPFCGIGTTIIEAKRLYRNGIGFDVSEEYCERAHKELSKNHFPPDTTKQVALFD